MNSIIFCSFTFLLLFQARELESKKPNEMVLIGFTASAKQLPLTLACDSKLYSYIQVGGITINGKPLNQSLQTAANDECTNDISKQGKKQGKDAQGKPVLSCDIWFGTNFTLNSTDYVYALYQCYSTKPSGGPVQWGKQKNGKSEVRNDVQKRANKNVVLKCNKGLTLIKVQSVYINDVKANFSQYPSLNPDLLAVTCFNQTIQSRKKGNKQNVKCNILNKEEYNGKLSIDYYCQEPPTIIKEPKEEYVAVDYTNEIIPTQYPPPTTSTRISTEQRMMQGILTITDLMYMGSNINFTYQQRIEDLSNPKSFLYKRLQASINKELTRNLKAVNPDVKEVTIKDWRLEKDLVVNFFIYLEPSDMVRDEVDVARKLNYNMAGYLLGSGIDAKIKPIIINKVVNVK